MLLHTVTINANTKITFICF